MYCIYFIALDYLCLYLIRSRTIDKDRQSYIGLTVIYYSVLSESRRAGIVHVLSSFYVIARMIVRTQCMSQSPNTLSRDARARSACCKCL